jgi:hypothetical protein
LESSRICLQLKFEAKSKLSREFVLVRWEQQNLGRPFGKHLDNEELDALVPSRSESGGELRPLDPEAHSEAALHVHNCPDCSSKVLEYRQLLNRLSTAAVAKAAAPGAGCPEAHDVDWHEVAAGMWPQLRTTQLIMHAALCGHCGPLLRAAASVNEGRASQEQRAPEDLKASPVAAIPVSVAAAPRWRFAKWLVPAFALLVIVALLWRAPSSPAVSLSGSQFAEWAVSAHRENEQGSLPLELHSDSQQELNEWLKKKAPFSVVLPPSSTVPGEERPYRLEGARLVRVGGKSAAFIAYQPRMQLQTADMRAPSVSLTVVPDSVAVAAGGVTVNFPTVNFHYAMVERYKVVTWSSHGLTYALVSQEGNATQQSCMVCHSEMKDRDLSKTRTPLYKERDPLEPLLQ